MMLKNVAALIAFLTMISGCSKSNDMAGVLNRLESKTFLDDKYAYPLPYRLYVPDDYNEKTTFPLLLVLHGGGGRGDDNKRHIDEAVAVFTSRKIQRKSPFFVLAPQCPNHSQWVNTPFKKTPFANYRQDDIPESDAMKMVMEILTSLERNFNIDPSRIYIIGTSMGASGTWDMITRYPHRFAAAVTISGVSDPSKATKITHLPIWSFHGRRDEITPLKVTQNMIDALQGSGSDCKLTIYEDKGHDIGHRVYGDPQMLNWLLSKRKSIY